MIIFPSSEIGFSKNRRADISFVRCSELKMEILPNDMIKIPTKSNDFSSWEICSENEGFWTSHLSLYQKKNKFCFSPNSLRILKNAKE